MSELAGFGEETPEDDVSFDLKSFNEGREKRVSVILLLDTSISMAPEKQPRPWPIDQLNEALTEWTRILRGDARLVRRAEVAIVTFGKGGVITHRLHDGDPFTPVALLSPPVLEASGVTPMIEAIQVAMDLSESRKRALNEAHIARFRPMIFMITDGAPTDVTGHLVPESAWRPVADEIARLEEGKHLAFFAVGVKGAAISVLKGLAPEGYWDLSDGNFRDFFRLATNSAGAPDPIAAFRQNLARLRGDVAK